MSVCHITETLKGSGSDGKESARSVGDLGLIPGSGRSLGEENGYPLQYSCLENSMDWGSWSATAHGVADSDMTEQTTLMELIESLHGCIHSFCVCVCVFMCVCTCKHTHVHTMHAGSYSGKKMAVWTANVQMYKYSEERPWLLYQSVLATKTK